ncbi:MAG TPA: hypothetical protein VHE32_04625 [Rhodanobacteraceae bacterium]|jgi:hypothetical protein|nr:hypothetical protein [Rhodanobacteraceae bacterium]
MPVRSDQPARQRGFAFVIASVVLVGASPAFATADFQLERLTPRELRVAPGGQTSYALRIRNVGTEAGVAHLGDGTHIGFKPLDDYESYTFGPPSGSGCGPLEKRYTDFINTWQFVFDAGPVAPNAYLDCVLTVTRDASSLHDMRMTWGVLIDDGGTPSYQHYVETALVGTLTDVSIEAHSSGFHLDEQGFAHADTELVIHNGGTFPLDSENVGACEDNVLRPFLTDGSGDGGCGDDGWHPTCFDWGYGFRTPVIGAGETYRCLIHLTSKEPYVDRLAFPIALEQFRYGAGFSFLDTNSGNDATLLRLEPDAPAGSGVPVSAMAWQVAVLCGVLLLALGVRAIRPD